MHTEDMSGFLLFLFKQCTVNQKRLVDQSNRMANWIF